MELGIAAVVGLIVGFATGWLIASRSTSASDATVEGLENELNEYRSKVDGHFAETGRLTRELADNYQRIYKHLATGAVELCDGSESQALLEFSDGSDSERRQSASAPTGYARGGQSSEHEPAPVSSPPTVSNPPPDIAAEKDYGEDDDERDSLRMVDLDKVVKQQEAAQRAAS